ncbi:hypothetical protein RB195_013758 [Necator americanus]|uniref:SCP domain-containing protein n=1 Tax=Necator americanus TaxID=51031 RepID=A0ABR1DX37_NECAM
MRCVGFYLALLAITSSGSEICPENTEQTDELRKKFLDLHNDFRSKLAKGLVKNKLLYNETALQASAMRKLGSDLNQQFAAERAVTKWWEEFTRHGNHWDNVYTTELHENGSLEHYAQIAWSRTTHIGCAVQDCSSSSMVVCRYKPTGKRLNDVIYEVGDTCSACPRGTICEQQTGLCV